MIEYILGLALALLFLAVAIRAVGNAVLAVRTRKAERAVRLLGVLVDADEGGRVALGPGQRPVTRLQAERRRGDRLEAELLKAQARAEQAERQLGALVDQTKRVYRGDRAPGDPATVERSWT